MNSDVLLIGGGIIGLSLARELKKKGVHSVTLLEQGTCGSESSWAAAGMLGPQAEADEGGAFFDMTLASAALYPALAASLLEETGIDIELDRAGTLYLAFTDDDVRDIRRRCEWQHRAGLAVEHLSADEARRAEPFISPDVREALYFPNDWQVDNRNLCTALRQFAATGGVDIRENTRVDSLIVEDGRVTGAETDKGVFTAGKTVLATGAWTSLIKLGLAEMPLKIEPVKGQMVAFHTAKRLFERVIYTPRGYIVPRSTGRIIAGSTSENAGFDRSTTDEAATRLRDMASEISPSTTGLATTDRWSGLRPRALDGMPVLGPIDGIDGLVIATAHYRNGILLAPLTAELIAGNLVDGHVPECFRTFGPDRFRGPGAGVRG